MKTNDPYSTVVGYVQNIIEHLSLEQSSLRNACVDLVNGVFTEEFEETRATSFIGAPRSVHHSYLRNTNAPLSTAIKWVVLERMEDTDFKEAI